MMQSEWMSLCMQIGILAVTSYAAIVVTLMWLIIHSRSNVWQQVASMLELMQRYFADAQREHVEATNELRPAINGAKDAMEAIAPAVAEAKENAEAARVAIEKTVTDALTVKTRAGDEIPVGKYVQENTHNFGDGLQKILIAINRVEMLMQEQRRGVK